MLIPIDMSTELDVVSKYRALVKASLDADSVYIRTKETLQALSEEGDLKDVDKAKVLSEVLASVNTSLVSSCMSTALDWANSEKNLVLKKSELEEANYRSRKEAEFTEQRKKDSQVANFNNSIQTRALYGSGTVDATVYVSSYSSVGSKLEKDLAMTQAQIDSAVVEKDLGIEKRKEVALGRQKAAVDMYVNYGLPTVGYSADGTATSVSVNSTGTLSDIQKNIAKNQANGYTWNAWANGVTSASSALGTAIASGEGGSAEYTPFLNSINTGIGKLIGKAEPYPSM